jgi:hypothetical protein
MKFLTKYLSVVFAVVATQAAGQFIDVTAANGIVNINEGTFDGNGVSFYDFNDDGLDDITLANGADGLLFYQNNGGTYSQVSFNIQPPVGYHIVMVLWADYDNDGDPDLLTTQLGGRLQLWENDGAYSFTDIGAVAGLDATLREFWGAAWCDYDHDGFLDLYVAKYYDELNDFNQDHKGLLYHSNGDGTFTDVTVNAGVDLMPRAIFQPVFFDYDMDGWEDLFLVIDRNAWTNEMFRNNGNGTFTKVSVAVGLNHAFDAMSGTVDDFDNDGDIDLYVTNGLPGNRLYRQNADHTFTNIAVSAGVTVNQICWGALWLDYDNNTLQDLYVATTSSTFGFGPQQNKFFINEGGGLFTDGTTTVGMLGDNYPTFCVAMGDVNNDGYYDLVYNCNDPFPSRLWQNDGGSNHYLSVDLEGVYSNRDGIGTMIHCYAGGAHYIRFTCSGENLAGQNSDKEIFGLGSVASVDSLVVEWNSGLVDKFYGLGVNQFLHIVEGSSQATISLAGNHSICAGDSLYVQASALLPYAWNTGSDEEGLWLTEEGVYFISASLGDMTFTSDSLNLSFYQPVVYEAAVTDQQCPGVADASATLNVAPDEVVAVTWSTGETGLGIGLLWPGEFSFTGTDANGCTFWGEVLVVEAMPFTDTVEVSHVHCAGIDDGAAVLSMVNAEPAGVLWSTGTTSLEVTGLAPGNYIYEGLTTLGCAFSGSVWVEPADTLQATVQVTDVYCSGADSGEANLTITGGQAPHVPDWGEDDPAALTAGSYTVVVTDAYACTDTVHFVVNEPPAISLSVVTEDAQESGAGGTAMAVVSGGVPPFQYDWGSGPAGEEGLTGLEPGDYLLTVIDANNCAAYTLFSIGLIPGVPDGVSSTAVITHEGDGQYVLTFAALGLRDMLISNAEGRMVRVIRSAERSVRLDLSREATGVYLVVLRDAMGRAHETFRLLRP